MCTKAGDLQTALLIGLVAAAILRLTLAIIAAVYYLASSQAGPGSCGFHACWPGSSPAHKAGAKGTAAPSSPGSYSPYQCSRFGMNCAGFEQYNAYQNAHQKTMTWDDWTTFINWAAPAATLLAMTTSWIPGVDVVTGSLAVVADAAAAVTNGVNAVGEFRQRHFLKGSIDALAALFSFGGMGVGIKAVRTAVESAMLLRASKPLFTTYATLIEKGAPDAERLAAFAPYWDKAGEVVDAEGIARTWLKAYLLTGGSSLTFESGKQSWEHGWLMWSR